MTGNEKYNNNSGRVGAELVRSAKARRKARAEHQTTFSMYCESSVCERLKSVTDKLAEKNLMFKFDGNHYAIFVSDISNRTQITEYTLGLEQVEDFAEKV